jgi:peptidoglycan/xylan/chitin deacetylase (PgdA/CDA1 family)
VLRIVQTPRDGSRKVVRDASGGYSEQYGQLPSYFVIESSGGGSGKVLCLTFDDGPDRRYTPGILDMLKRHGVRATFFVIGANADQNIGLNQAGIRRGPRCRQPHLYTSEHCAGFGGARRAGIEHHAADYRKRAGRFDGSLPASLQRR